MLVKVQFEKSQKSSAITTSHFAFLKVPCSSGGVNIHDYSFTRNSYALLRIMNNRVRISDSVNNYSQFVPQVYLQLSAGGQYRGPWVYSLSGLHVLFAQYRNLIRGLACSVIRREYRNLIRGQACSVICRDQRVPQSYSRPGLWSNGLLAVLTDNKLLH